MPVKVETTNISRGKLRGSLAREYIIADLAFRPDTGGNPTHLIAHRLHRKLPLTRGTYRISTIDVNESDSKKTEHVSTVKLRGKKEVAELGRQVLENRANEINVAETVSNS